MLYGTPPSASFLRRREAIFEGTDPDSSLDRHGVKAHGLDAYFYVLNLGPGTYGGQAAIRAFSNCRNSSLSEEAKKEVYSHLEQTQVVIDCVCEGSEEAVHSFMTEFATDCSALIMMREDARQRLFIRSTGQEVGSPVPSGEPTSGPTEQAVSTDPLKLYAIVFGNKPDHEAVGSLGMTLDDPDESGDLYVVESPGVTGDFVMGHIGVANDFQRVLGATESELLSRSSTREAEVLDVLRRATVYCDCEFEGDEAAIDRLVLSLTAACNGVSARRSKGGLGSFRNGKGEILA